MLMKGYITEIGFMFSYKAEGLAGESAACIKCQGRIEAACTVLCCAVLDPPKYRVFLKYTIIQQTDMLSVYSLL